MSSEARAGLNDLVVLEMAGSRAGAYTAKLLGDLGATVVLVEPAGGAPLRSDPAEWAAWVTSRSIVVTSGSAAAAQWLERADVVIESSADRPLQPASATRSEAIRVRISPFGSSGPYASWRGADIVDQAIGGHLYLSGDPNRDPLQGPAGQGALAAGAYGAIGAMAALHSRRRGVNDGGMGQIVEVTHHETLAALHQFTDVRYTHGHERLRRMGNRYAGPGSPIGMYPAGDGWIALTIATGPHFETLLALSGLDHLLVHPEITSMTDLQLRGDIFDPALTEWLSHYTVAEAVELLQSVRLAAGPVLTMTELLDDPQLAVRDWWVPAEMEGRTVRLPGRPFRIDGWAWNAGQAPGSGGESVGPPTVEPGSGQPANLTLTAAASARPLDGLRVLDLTRVWAGPLACRILAELGADVVIVEAPWGRMPLAVPQSYADATRFFPDNVTTPNPWNRNGFINKFAVEKRSLCLDLAVAEARTVFERLVASVDVVVENYSPRVMPNWGLDEARLHELNPHLIYMTMPGYGRTGPARDYSAYGPVIDSHAGLSTLMGYPELDAWKCGIAWPDPVGGIHGALAVLVALWGRETGTGPSGPTIEVAQFETAVAMIADRLIRTQLDGGNPPILGNRHPLWAPHGVYPCAGDDRWLALAVPDADAWTGLCGVAALPSSWRAWTIEQRRSAHDEIDSAIGSWSRGVPHEVAATHLQAAGVPAAPVVDGGEMVEDPHLAARGFYTHLAHPDAGTHAWGPVMTARLSGTPAAVTLPAPGLGQHNREVLRDWAGLDDAGIDALIAIGAVADRPPG